MSRRLLTRALPALLAATSLVGCSDDPGDNLIAVLVGGVIGLMLLVTWGCGLYSGAIVAGGINLHLNRTRPTRRSKRWGWFWSILNLVNGLAMAGLTVRLQMEGETSLEALLYAGGYSTAALAVGAAALVFTVRAQPGQPADE